MKSFVITAGITCLTVLGACSEAGFQGYGPRGEGHVGSAYGYSDQQISKSSWDVQYVDITAAEARTGAIRRAQEVCVLNGFAGANYSPQTAALEDLIIVKGRAQCVKTGETAKVTPRTAASRVQEINAEISALQNEKQMIAAESGSLTHPGLFAIGNLVDQGRNVEIDTRISQLMAERVRLGG